MKQATGLRLVAISILLISAFANATTQVGAACPQKFIATVTNIENVQSGAFPKVEINFQIIQTLKGEEVTSKKIQIVKDGPLQFKNGEVYTVESRESWLCSASLFTKI
jgi:hypothetical protein